MSNQEADRNSPHPNLRLPNLNDLRARSDEERKHIISRYLSRLLHRSAGMMDGLLIPLEVNGVYLSSGCLIVAAVTIEKISDTASFTSLDDVFDTLSIRIEQALSDRCITTIAEIDGQLVVIGSYSRMRLSEIEGASGIESSFARYLDNIISACGRELGLELCAYVSYLFEGLELLPYVYERISEYRHFRVYLGKWADNMPRTVQICDQDFRPDNCLHRMGELFSAIKESRWDDYSNIVDKLFSDILICEPYSLSYLNIRIQAFMAELVRELSRQCILSISAEQESSICIRLCTVFDAGELNMAFTETMEDILAKLTRRSTPSSTSLVREAQEYIQANIRDVNLSPVMIADKLGVSRTTLSSAFSASMGKYLSDYIHRIRLSLAEEMMLNTNYTIQEISEMAGYGSITTMHRAFQRYHSTSPAKYRSFLRGGGGPVRSDKQRAD